MNNNLGNYDMVLGLSSSKINYMFKRMYRKKQIKQDWCFLTNSMGKEVKTLTNKEAKDYWNNMGANKEKLDKATAELRDLDQQMQKEIKDQNWAKVGQLSGQKDAKQKEVDQLEANEKNAALYDLGLIAKIAEPKIEILKDNRKELLFQITFKKGSKLFYKHEGKKAEFDLSPKSKSETYKYAFRVSVGSVNITSDRKVIEANGEEKTLREKGISDNDFTISALFLDFENANISTYDPGASHLPQKAGDTALLKAALDNYFKGIAKTDNPFVLGYGINKKEVKDGERALLYPTGLAYSTSYGEGRKASFNFLMLINNHPFPNSGNAGVLPSSLLEYALDKTATVNGVFGLDDAEFDTNYIPLLSHSLCNHIKTKMGSKCDGTKVYSNNNIRIDFSTGSAKDGVIDLQYMGIKARQDNKGVDISYHIKAKAEVHQEVEALFGSTVGVDWSLSTSGTARNSQGKEGNLVVTLKAGTSGKLELKPNYSDKFKLGFDNDEPRYKHTRDRIWDAVSKTVGAVLEAITTIENDLGDDFDNLSSINNIGEALNIANLEKLENKVILPVASVYKYKNVRLLNGSAKDTTLLFDTSYGTTTT